MKKEKFDIEETAASLAVKASANGNELDLEEMAELASCTDINEDDIIRLLHNLHDESITFYSDFSLDKKKIRELDKKIKECSDDEKNAVTGRENSVVLYLNETAELKFLGSEREQELLYALNDGNEDAKGELIEGCLYLPVWTAEKYIGRGMLFLDLVQEGNLLLMTIADTWTDENISFSAFCVFKLCRLMQELTFEEEKPLKIPAEMAEDLAKVLMSIKKFSASGKKADSQEIAKDTALSAERVNELLALGKKMTETENTDNGTDVQPDETEIQLSAQVSKMLSSIPKDEAKVIELNFGLSGKKPMSVSEIARYIGISEEDAGRLLQQGIKHLGN